MATAVPLEALPEARTVSRRQLQPDIEFEDPYEKGRLFVVEEGTAADLLPRRERSHQNVAILADKLALFTRSAVRQKPYAEFARK